MAGILDRWPSMNNHNGDVISELGPGPVWDRPRCTNPIIQYILGGDDEDEDDEDEISDAKYEEDFGDVEPEDEGGGHKDYSKDGLVCANWDEDGDSCGGAEGGSDEPSDGSCGNESGDCDVMREFLRLDDTYCPLNFRACVHSLTQRPSRTENLAGQRKVVRVAEDAERTFTSSKKERHKMVCFSSHVRVHHLVVWAFAHRAARHGPWEQAARDRKRFEQRIAEAEKTIAPCFGLRSILPEAGQMTKTPEADRREGKVVGTEKTNTCNAFCHRRPQSFPGMGNMLKMSDRGKGNFVERSGRKTEQQGGKKRLRSPPPLTLTLD
uniref:protein phosphatase 1 regulatory subunit 15A-like n=1 Tax=Myxine glutinosa TaxID=7769 RepID=UPI0035902C2D